MTEDPHVAISHELLVRYLDAWLPLALHGHKRVTYVDTGPASAAAAARVVCEFEDDLPRHAVTMVVGGTASADEVLARRPPGLTVVPTTGSLLTALRDAHALDAPAFAWLRWPVPGDLLSTVASGRSTELVLIGGDAAAESLLTKAGLTRLVRVDLVDGAGRAEHVCFATAVEKSVEKFKDELWALDEYCVTRTIRTAPCSTSPSRRSSARCGGRSRPTSSRPGAPHSPRCGRGRCTRRSTGPPTFQRRCRRC